MIHMRYVKILISPLQSYELMYKLALRDIMKLERNIVLHVLQLLQETIRYK